jgi:hypothetical protein
MAIDGEIVSNLPVPGPGRDSKYRPEFNEQARKLCLLGATDEEIADFFDVCVATIYNWKTQFPAFLEATRAGKVVADMEVAESLFRRATGEVAFVERAYKTNEGDYKVVTLRQFIPGDVTAQRLWLLNRRPQNWRDKQDMELSGGLAIGNAVFKGLNDSPAS